MKELSTITIMRKWNNPQILITVNNELIELKMTMTDFQRIVCDELKKSLKEALPGKVGPITWTFKQDTFNQQLFAAIDTAVPELISRVFDEVVTSIKQESIKVM